MPSIFTKTTYLQMFQPPVGALLNAPLPAVEVERAIGLTIDTYRQLYRSVGNQLHWVNRLLMPDAELQAILSNPQVEIFILQVEDKSAGYVELDRRQQNEIELAYFGLVPDFIGQGLGKFFLNWTLQQAWSYQPTRVWVHTCDLDHPAALPNYQKAGFVIYDEQLLEQMLPEQNSVPAKISPQ